MNELQAYHCMTPPVDLARTLIYTRYEETDVKEH